MNVLIDIGHPAHVHLFKHLARDLINQGSYVIFTVRSGEKEADLLKKLGFNYRIIGERKRGVIKKIYGLLFFSMKIYRLAHKNKIDLFISHGSMYAGYAAFLKGKPHIALEDSGNMEQLRFSIPVSDVILSPDILKENLGKKQIKYTSYHELIYLHPNHFTPKVDIRKLLKLKPEENYCLIRLSKFGASHDINQKGLSSDEKLQLVKLLNTRLKVFISAEGDLPEDLIQYKYPLSSDLMHDFISGADIVISEGATIASEAGVLGVPSLYVNSIVRSYNEDQEKYGLVFNFRSFEGVPDKIKEILNIANYKNEFQTRRLKMLQDKIDIKSLLSWFVMNYPESKKIMRENPEYQYNYK